ncbi:MAG TPA: IS4 family transposase [Chryseolinea sp.]|nr:IS4 family transposase [Chryseolinea sp.]
MNKSIHFSGQPTFSQLINLIPKDIVFKCIQSAQSDHYYKKFTTWHHLVTMLFTCYGHCHSLREVVTGMRALEGRLQSTGISYFPTRSTFSEANAKRSSEVFEHIYFKLKAYWDHLFPDSPIKAEKLYILDSTTIKLFQEIFKGSGCSKSNGRRKGGLKVHMAVQSQQSIPSIIHISQAACNDVTFVKYVNLPSGSTVIMDRGYRNYKQYNLWSDQQIRWITRMHPHTYFKVNKTLKVSSACKQKGIQKDECLQLGFPQKRISKVSCRRITFLDKKSKKKFEFITNDFSSEPIHIAQLYKKRWSIELLFKRLKQNMPLQYFLGDNQNAIRIQIWCALIADLLLQLLRRQVKRKWAFSNIVSIVRLHLFNYLDLLSFLENPERSIIQTYKPTHQLKLDLSG